MEWVSFSYRILLASVILLNMIPPTFPMRMTNVHQRYGVNALSSIYLLNLRAVWVSQLMLVCSFSFQEAFVRMPDTHA